MTKPPARAPRLKWPAWIPYPISWLNAFVLAGLIGLYSWLARPIVSLIAEVINYPFESGWLDHPKPLIGIYLSVLILLFAIILPIAFITFLHHWLHLLLAKFLPTAQSPIIGVTRGWFPGLMSWWAGVWGLIVTLTGLLVATVLLLMFSPQDPSQLQRGIGLSTFVWFVCVAYLYQLRFRA